MRIQLGLGTLIGLGVRAGLTLLGHLAPPKIQVTHVQLTPCVRLIQDPRMFQEERVRLIGGYPQR